MKEILIIENDEMFTQNIKFHLEQKKYRVLTTSNGKTALGIAKKNLPDLILSEINLPGMDGFNLCKELRQSPATNKIPIIFQTSRAEDSDKEEALAAGANMFLIKPLKIKTLLDIIFEMIGKSYSTNDRILLISEDPPLSADLKEFLIKKGYKVLLSGYTPNVVCDVKPAPDIILLEFMRETETIDEKILSFTLEQNLSDVPIIVLGTRNESAIFRKSMGEEVSDYLAKPVNFLEILAAIELQLEKVKFRRLLDSNDIPDSNEFADKELISAIATRKELRKRKQKSILIIEDDLDLISNLRLQLELNRFTVLSALSGEIGIELADINLPDLIISDIMLPGISGYEVRQLLNNKIITRNIPFLFLSAKVEYEDIRKGMSLGADDYLTKPVKIKSLLKIIKKKFSHQIPEMQSSAPISVETPPPANTASVETEVSVENEIENFSKLFKQTREILPIENPAPRPIPQPVTFVQQEVNAPRTKFSAFEEFYSRENRIIDYQSICSDNIVVVRVNIHWGVKKESNSFYLFLLAVVNKNKSIYVIDLMGAEHLDSTFLGVVVMFKKKVSQNGSRVKLVVSKEMMMGNAIFLQGISRLFEVYNDAKSAIDSD